MRSGHTEACIDLCRLAGLAAGRRARRADERRRHGHARAAMSRAFAEAQASSASRSPTSSPTGRRATSSSSGSSEFSVADRDRHAQGLCLRDAVRQGLSHGLVHGRIGDGRDVPTRLHRANMHRATFSAARCRSRQRCARFERDGRGVIVFLRDGSAGVPVSALPQDDTAPRKRRERQWRRDRARRPDPARSRHFIDPAAHLRAPPLCRPRWVRHRDR